MAAAQTSVFQNVGRGRVGRGVSRLLLGVLAALLFPLLFGLGWSSFIPIFRPGVLRFLALGVGATVGTALLAIALSLPLATLLGMARATGTGAARWPSVVFIEGIRAVPVLLLILYVSRQLTTVGLPPVAWIAVVIALTLYTAAVNAELIRAGIQSLDRGQFEAARSLGLSYWQAMRYVILPQTFSRILPPLIAQFTTLLKDTSLGAIIGFLELQRRATIVYQQPGFNAMAILYVTALIYFVLNYILGKFSERVQRGRGSVPIPLDAA